MKVPYIVNYDGTYYPANTELPDEVAKALEQSVKEREKFERQLKKTKLENVTAVNKSTFK